MKNTFTRRRRVARPPPFRGETCPSTRCNVVSLTSPRPFTAAPIVPMVLSTSTVFFLSLSLSHACLVSTADSCKAGMVVGALRIACNGPCTASRFQTAEENPGCLVGCHEGLDCIRHYNRCPTLFASLCSLWPSTCECISPTDIFIDLLRGKLRICTGRHVYTHHSFQDTSIREITQQFSLE